MTDLRKVLAHNMKEKRRKLKLTQYGLAERIDTSPYYLSMIERGKKFPSPEMMQRIAAGLEIDTLELFGIETFPSGTIIKYQKEALKIIGKVATQMLEHKLEQLNQKK
jgi:transcriptional regulator with XRE-family HTH domain